MHVFVSEIVAETFIRHDLRTSEVLKITLGPHNGVLLAEAWANVGIPISQA